MSTRQVPLFPKFGQSAEVHDLATELPTGEIPGRKTSVVEASIEPQAEVAEQEPAWKSRVRELRTEMEARALAAVEDDHARLSPEDIRVVKARQIVAVIKREKEEIGILHELVGLESCLPKLGRVGNWEKFNEWLNRILERYGNPTVQQKPKRRSA